MWSFQGKPFDTKYITKWHLSSSRYFRWWDSNLGFPQQAFPTISFHHHNATTIYVPTPTPSAWEFPAARKRTDSLQ